jgi:hypothetical protein
VLPSGEVEKTGQSAQSSPAAENLPGTQLIQTEFPAVEYFPATQLVQVADEEAAATTENLPAMQLVHCEAPAVVEYVPAIQPVHVLDEEAATAAENVPAMQSVQGPPAPENLPATQSTQFEYHHEPGGDDAPAQQLLHDEAPVAEEYLPARHSVQGPPAPDNVP